MSRARPAHRWLEFVLDNSLLLLLGTVLAVVWANVDLPSYDRIAHPLHFLVNDIAMVFFFALAAKEVFEATLPGGALASPARAASPLAAAVGGMALPASIYAALAWTLGPADLLRGWAIPCATDIAFSAMVARVVFPVGHPAIPFLLLLAIADDALGLAVLALFYPSGELSIGVFALGMAAALGLAWWLRARRTQSFWAYVIGPGLVSWAALFWGGFHPALALVPVIPFMPHEPRDLGIFDERELHAPDTLNRFEHWWRIPVQIILLLFGFTNAGVPFGSIGPGTFYVLAGLIVGKPIGILALAAVANALGARLPAGLRYADVLLLGTAAAIGFTVALFFATAAFPGGLALSETKMGALLSFAAAPLAILLARFIRPTVAARSAGSPRADR
jgi:Na+:H+ antiporter, NhaA family